MVTWEDNETELFWRLYGTQVAYHVVLHEEECMGTKVVTHVEKGGLIESHKDVPEAIRG